MLLKLLQFYRSQSFSKLNNRSNIKVLSFFSQRFLLLVVHRVRHFFGHDILVCMQLEQPALMLNLCSCTYRSPLPSSIIARSFNWSRFFRGDFFLWYILFALSLSKIFSLARSRSGSLIFLYWRRIRRLIWIIMSLSRTHLPRVVTKEAETPELIWIHSIKNYK